MDTTTDMIYIHDKHVREWLDGKKKQYLEDGQWRDMPSREAATKVPHFYADRQYRDAPQVLRYRVARFRLGIGKTDPETLRLARDLQEEHMISRSLGFEGWISDWVEVTL